ncbi:GNAT family N-acetyltransferase [uncultured Kiloniella sp.]|uniref:GNAT family N-acetyltransferase n=1 Tax=uncultured Kiloniella sp. TaxID=1133091 RepID=UPI0026031500|nr:GNAT family N-acetyltransferase [uncultured Kiloniella sp.]
MVSESVFIRIANRNDMLALVSMAEEFARHLTALGEDRSGFDTEASLAQLLKHGFGDKPIFSALMAENGGKPVGYAIYNFGFWADSFQSMIFMTDLFVREEWRSKGIGKMMIKELRQVGRENDCDLLVWTVWANNSPAQKFYKNLGAIALNDEVFMKLDI